MYTDLALGVYLETIEATKFELEPTGKYRGEEPEMKPVKVFRYPNDNRQRAADTILAYGYGKPTQIPLDPDAPGGAGSTVTLIIKGGLPPIGGE